MSLLSQATKGVRPRASKVVLYGVEKIGKSTLLSKAPNPIFLDTESGTDLLGLNRIEIKSSGDLFKTLHEIVTAQHEYKTVVIDSIDFTEDLLKEKVKSDNDWATIEQPGFGKGFNILREEFDKFLFKLDPVIRKGIHVVLIGHSTVKPFTPPESTESYNRYELKLDKENSVKAKSWADVILFANYKTIVTEGADKKQHAVGGKVRQLYASRTAAYDAGNRFGLPDVLPMEYSAIDKIFEFSQKTPASDKGADNALPVSESPQVVEDFYKLTLDLPSDKFRAFLLNRDQDPEIVSADYAERVLKNIPGFKKAVLAFEE
jgi:hypothetical protein